MRPLVVAEHRGTALVAVGQRPFVHHAVGALVGHLVLVPSDGGAAADRDGRGQAELLRCQLVHRVLVRRQRPALQLAVVVVDLHIAHRAVVVHRDALAAMHLRRRRGACRLPHEGVARLRRRAAQRQPAVRAGRMAVRGVEVGRRGRRRRCRDGDHEGRRAAVRGTLGADKVTSGVAERMAERGAAAGGRDGVAAAEVVGRPTGRHRRHRGQTARVAQTYTLSAGYPERGTHTHRQRRGLERAAVDEVATVSAADGVGAGRVEHKAHLVGVVEHGGVDACRGRNIPVVFRRAEQRQRVHHGVAHAHVSVAAYVQTVGDDGYPAAHHRGTRLGGARHAVEAQHTIAVVRAVPLHHGRRGALSANQRAAFDIPPVFVACRGDDLIAHHGTLADGAEAFQFEPLAFDNLNVVGLLVAASAVVVHAVRHLVVEGNVFDGINRCRRRRRLKTLPAVGRYVAAAGVGIVDKLHRLTLAHTYHLAPVRSNGVGRHGDGRCRGRVDKLDAHGTRAVATCRSLDGDEQHAEVDIAPGDGNLVAEGADAVRGVAVHLPRVAHRTVRTGVGMRRVCHGGARAGHHETDRLVEIIVLEVVEALGVEVAGNLNVAGRGLRKRHVAGHCKQR